MYNVCHIYVINYKHESVQKLNKPLLQIILYILYILYDTHVHRYFVYMHSNLYKSLAMEPPLGQNHVCYCSSVRAASRLSHRYSASLVVNVMGGLYFRTFLAIPSVVRIILNFFIRLQRRDV